MNLLIKQGRVLDPSQNIDQIMDILVLDGKIAEIAPQIDSKDAQIIDAQGLLVTPGLIDVHTHLREPGYEAKEDIASGTRAAAAGGVTTIACMPNTRPPIDSSILVSGVKDRAQREGKVKVEVIGCITKGQEGKELAEMGDMAQVGAMAFSDDGRFVMDSKLFTSGLEYASIFDKAIISHAEDYKLSQDGYMHEGTVSARLGIPGLPAVAEDIAVVREILLAEYAGAHIHIAHVSTAGATDIIRQAKKRGVQVTAEVAIHHLTLDDENLSGFNTAFKVSPPLRDQKHVDAVRLGVLDGTFDAIVTDHAPHAFEEKDVEFRYAPNGFAGLETLVSVGLTDLVHTGIIPLHTFISKLTIEPAKVFNLERGTLAVGAPADITIIDLEKKYQIDSAKFYTKGKHSPYDKKQCQGAAVYTIVDGKVVMKDGVVC